MDDNAILLTYDTRVNYITFWSIVGIGCFTLITYLAIRRSKVNWRELFGVLLSEYVVVVIMLTVVFRETPVYPEGYHNTFWSDKTLLSGNVFVERVINTLLFFPIGVLLCGLLKSHRLIHTLLLGVLISLSVEIMQLQFNKGVADIEDIAFNGLGLTVGALLSMMIIKS